VSSNTLALVSFGLTAVVVIALFAAGILPLWIAILVLVVDGAFNYMLSHGLARRG
jgi:hypothetical protein